MHLHKRSCLLQINILIFFQDHRLQLLNNLAFGTEVFIYTADLNVTVALAAFFKKQV